MFLPFPPEAPASSRYGFTELRDSSGRPMWAITEGSHDLAYAFSPRAVELILFALVLADVVTARLAAPFARKEAGHA